MTGWISYFQGASKSSGLKQTIAVFACIMYFGAVAQQGPGLRIDPSIVEEVKSMC
jgi:hypothetical protein